MHVVTAPASRRLFLRHAAALATLGGGAPLALNLSLLSSAAAQTGGEYRALVCLFLRGGNDAFNTVLATDAASWSAYTATRGGSGTAAIALPAAGTPRDPAAAGLPARLGGVVPIRPANPQGRSYALHPALAALKPLFEDRKRLAVVANVGPLAAPTAKADLARPTHPLPPRLFSHNDQQNLWQAMAPEGASRGWGGRMGDLLAAANGHALFTAVSTNGRPTWASGTQVRPVAVSAAGAIRYGVDPDGSVFGSAAVGDALQRIGARQRSANRMEADHADIAQRAIATQAALAAVLPPATDARWAGAGAAGSAASLQYRSPDGGAARPNPLAERLQTVARVMAAAAGGALAVRRQVFFVELEGFDTHDDQNADHAELLAQLAHGIVYFDAVLGALGLRERVVLFTASDFGRTFTSNGDGTDHGWGAHHFVLGPALAGGDIHGRFPTLGLKNATGNRFDSSPDQLHNGVLLPGLAVDQMAAAFGRWMGLSAAQTRDVLPNLARFDGQAPAPVA